MKEKVGREKMVAAVKVELVVEEKEQEQRKNHRTCSRPCSPTQMAAVRNGLSTEKM